MGFKLGKFLKKAVKLGSKLAAPILSVVPGGALALRAQQTLKSLGTNLKAARLGKLEPLSVRAGVEKVAPRAPFRRLAAFRPRSTSGNGSRMPQKRPAPNGKGKRSPPKGGLDLAAMAAQWRGAGKPGSWRDWIKSHQLRKGA